MGAITPVWFADFETRMQFLTQRNYESLNNDTWWRRLLAVRTTGTHTEVLTWLLSTARIRAEGDVGGNKHFEDLVSQMQTITTAHAGSALRLHVDQLTDTDANGVDLAAQWSQDMGDYMAYWPQELATDFLLNGHTAKYNCYDGVPFFSNAHPYNPYKTSLGNFSNINTAGSGAGAVPIDYSVSPDIALQNLGKVFAGMASIKMPNGVSPRRIRPADIYCGPQLFPRVVQLTSAKFLAQAASSGGGGADVEAIIKALGYATPILVDEMAGFESDTSYFVGAKQRVGSQLGAAVYTEREPFSIKYYTGTGGGTGVDALLNRLKEFEWHVDGRNSISPGHPFLLFKCKAT